MKKNMIVICILLCLCLASAAVFAGCGDTQNASQDGAGEVTVEEQTIFDDQGIKAVVKGYGKFEDELLSYDRELLIDVTNNLDQDISFGLRQCSVNGYMVESYYSYTIETGKTETYPVIFDASELESLGITTIADYEFCIVAEDNDTYETLVESDPIIIKTSAYEGFEYKFDESGTVVYDTDNVKIIAKDQTEDEFFGPCVSIYVANDTDKNIMVSAASCSVNGKEVQDYYFGSEPAAGKHSIDLLSFGEDERPEKIESLTLSFAIYDFDTGDPIVEKTEPATVEF